MLCKILITGILLLSGLFFCVFAYSSKSEAKEIKPFSIKIDNTVTEKTDLILAKLEHLDEKIKRMNQEVDLAVIRNSIPATYRTENRPAVSSPGN